MQADLRPGEFALVVLSTMGLRALPLSRTTGMITSDNPETCRLYDDDLVLVVAVSPSEDTLAFAEALVLSHRGMGWQVMRSYFKRVRQ